MTETNSTNLTGSGAHTHVYDYFSTPEAFNRFKRVIQQYGGTEAVMPTVMRRGDPACTDAQAVFNACMDLVNIAENNAVVVLNALAREYVDFHEEAIRAETKATHCTPSYEPKLADTASFSTMSKQEIYMDNLDRIRIRHVAHYHQIKAFTACYAFMQDLTGEITRAVQKYYADPKAYPRVTEKDIAFVLSFRDVTLCGTPQYAEDNDGAYVRNLKAVASDVIGKWMYASHEDDVFFSNASEEDYNKAFMHTYDKAPNKILTTLGRLGVKFRIPKLDDYQLDYLHLNAVKEGVLVFSDGTTDPSVRKFDYRVRPYAADRAYANIRYWQEMTERTAVNLAMPSGFESVRAIINQNDRLNFPGRDRYIKDDLICADPEDGFAVLNYMTESECADEALAF